MAFSDPSVLSPAELPRLPVEVHHHILRLCDPATLAVSSTVSLEFLQLAAPLLYNDIDIAYGKQTEQLFCSRDPAADQIQLHAYLNLKHVHALTIHAAAHEVVPMRLSPDRLSPSGLAVDLLTLRPLGHPINNAAPRSDHIRWGTDHKHWNTLYPLMAPVSVHIHGLTSDPLVPRGLPAVDLTSASTWFPSLRKIIVAGVEAPAVSTSAFVPPGVTEPPLAIVYDLRSWDPDGSVHVPENAFSRFVPYQLSIESLQRCRPNGRLEDIVVQFATKEALSAFAGELKQYVQSPHVPADQRWLDEQLETGRIRLEVD